jgi:hypothetical protein
MYTETERDDYKDFLQQIEVIKRSKELDMDGDGQVDIAQLPLIMSLLGEPKCPPDKLETIKKMIMEEREPDQTQIPLEYFLNRIRPYLDSFGSKEEVNSAFHPVS